MGDRPVEQTRKRHLTQEPKPGQGEVMPSQVTNIVDGEPERDAKKMRTKELWDESRGRAQVAHSAIAAFLELMPDLDVIVDAGEVYPMPQRDQGHAARTKKYVELCAAKEQDSPMKRICSALLEFYSVVLDELGEKEALDLLDDMVMHDLLYAILLKGFGLDRKGTARNKLLALLGKTCYDGCAKRMLPSCAMNKASAIASNKQSAAQDKSARPNCFGQNGKQLPQLSVAMQPAQIKRGAGKTIRFIKEILLLAEDVLLMAALGHSEGMPVWQCGLDRERRQRQRQTILQNFTAPHAEQFILTTLVERLATSGRVFDEVVRPTIKELTKSCNHDLFGAWFVNLANQDDSIAGEVPFETVCDIVAGRRLQECTYLGTKTTLSYLRQCICRYFRDSSSWPIDCIERGNSGNDKNRLDVCLSQDSREETNPQQMAPLLAGANDGGSDPLMPLLQSVAWLGSGALMVNTYRPLLTLSLDPNWEHSPIARCAVQTTERDGSRHMLALSIASLVPLFLYRSHHNHGGVDIFHH